jgi:hypothetical protein
MMTMSKDIKEVTRVNLIKNISPRRPTRGTTNLALQFPSCPLDATSALRDGAHSMFGRRCEPTSVSRWLVGAGVGVGLGGGAAPAPTAGGAWQLCFT